MKRRLLAILLALSMLFTLVPPNIAMAAGENVAKIGTTEYDTLDAAIKDVQDGKQTEAIEILKDCETHWEFGQYFGKKMTINGEGYKVTFKTGFCVGPKSEVTFNKCQLEMNDIKYGCNDSHVNPSHDVYKYPAGIVVNGGGRLNINDGILNIQRCVGDGIYGHVNAYINFSNSNINILNNSGNGIVKDGQKITELGYITAINNSVVNINENRAGITNTWNVTITDSKLNVLSNRGNGSNSSNFYFTDSVVNFNDNGSHGLSAGNLSIIGSQVTANKNGGNGVHVTGTFKVDELKKDDGTAKQSVLSIKENKCGISSKWTKPGALLLRGQSEINSGDVIIEGNSGHGIHLNKSNASLEVKETSNVQVVKNNANIIPDKETEKNGGGLLIDEGATAILPKNLVLYNNHAETAGDDIYSTGDITFGPVGTDWYLDGAPDCEDHIDGWYQDGSAKEDASDKEKLRWNAHTNPTHIEKFTSFDQNNLATVNGPLALKAAHGLIPQVVDNNKSKEATNLDGNYESKITLTLPHGTEEPDPDPVGPRVETKAAPSEGEIADISWGSRVEDYMGYVEGDYDFEFINDAKRLSVSVNGKSYPAVQIDDNVYGFKPLSEEENTDPMSIANPEDGTSDSPTIYYEYYLTYIPGDKGKQEHFVWEIATTVGAFDDVQLHYAVKLTNPKSEPGTYGKYDQYGKYGDDPKKSLYTNNSAILYPIDTEGLEGVPEIYKKPTVSYTVSKPNPPTPPTPTPIDPAGPEDLNTVDHYSYIIGYPDGLVRPQGKVTRAEVATIFFRMLTDEARTEGWSQTNNFSDVAAKDWYSNAISTLSNMGIIAGYEDGTFRPNAPITRAEYAKIAVSFFKENVKDYQGTFSDVAEGQWYTQYVETAAALGLISGYPDGTFAPNKTITRAEACTITNSTLNRKPCKDHLLPVEEMVNWPDNQPDAWYYYEMQEATNSHDYEWDGETENWTKKLSQRDWVQLEKEWSEANSATGGGEVKNENK